jgi:hypothetical protein
MDAESSSIRKVLRAIIAQFVHPAPTPRVNGRTTHRWTQIIDRLRIDGRRIPANSIKGAYMGELRAMAPGHPLGPLGSREQVSHASIVQLRWCTLIAHDVLIKGF